MSEARFINRPIGYGVADRRLPRQPATIGPQDGRTATAQTSRFGKLRRQEVGGASGSSVATHTTRWMGSSGFTWRGTGGGTRACGSSYAQPSGRPGARRSWDLYGEQLKGNQPRMRGTKRWAKDRATTVRRGRPRSVSPDAVVG